MSSLVGRGPTIALLLRLGRTARGHEAVRAQLSSAMDGEDGSSDTDSFSSDTDKEVAKPPRKIRKLRESTTARAAEYPATGSSDHSCVHQIQLDSSDDDDDVRFAIGHDQDGSPAEINQVSIILIKYVKT